MTHNDELRALVQHGFQIGDQAKMFNPQTNEILGMNLKDHQLSVNFKDRSYEVQIES